MSMTDDETEAKVQKLLREVEVSHIRASHAGQPWNDVDSAEARVRQHYGDEVIDELMKDWPEPTYQGDSVSGHSWCERCGAYVASCDQHTAHHRFISLKLQLESWKLIKIGYQVDQLANLSGFLAEDVETLFKEIALDEAIMQDMPSLPDTWRGEPVVPWTQQHSEYFAALDQLHCCDHLGEHSFKAEDLCLAAIIPPELTLEEKILRAKALVKVVFTSVVKENDDMKPKRDKNKKSKKRKKKNR